MSMSTGATMKPEKKVRHPQTGKPVQVRLQPDLLDKIDDWRRRQPDLPNLPETIRRLVESALKRGK